MSKANPPEQTQLRVAKAVRRGELASSAWSERKGILKLHAARSVDEFWRVAQKLIQRAAPSSARWLCLRPVRMSTAMMLLRESAFTRRRAGGLKRRKKPYESVVAHGKESALLKDLFTRHRALSHFRSNPRTPIVHLKSDGTILGRQKRECNFCAERGWKFGVILGFWKQTRLQGALLLHRKEEEGDFTRTELERLREFRPHFETALRRVIAKVSSQKF